jgi:hypothetical protein
MRAVRVIGIALLLIMAAIFGAVVYRQIGSWTVWPLEGVRSLGTRPWSTLAPVLSPTPTPTPTPMPDSDSDGLTDSEEKGLGTNPFQRDSDVDGLSDLEEVQKGSNPLFQDTDRDGTLDGDDVFPLADYAVRVSILRFIDITPGGADPFSDIGDPYFKVYVGDEETKTNVYTTNRGLLQDLEPFVFNLPDNIRFVRVGIQAWDSDPDAYDQYDVSNNPGSDAWEGLTLFQQFDRLTDTLILEGDGTQDGGLEGLQAAITVRVESMPSR